MSGITYDYMEEYIRGLIPESEGRLKELEVFAKENGVPIAQKETIKFLEFMVSMKKPLRILELGTAIGYSAIIMHDAAGCNPHITTIERSEEMIKYAKENIKAYGVATHRHTPEIEEQLGYAAGEEVLINFTPHLVPMQRGILVTAYANLKKEVTYEEVKAVYDKYYKDEYFIRVLNKDETPETRWVEGSNFVDVNFKIDERTGRIIMMGALDNLVKGAAGQAVQNMNIIFGLPENEGLQQVPMFP